MKILIIHNNYGQFGEYVLARGKKNMFELKTGIVHKRRHANRGEGMMGAVINCSKGEKEGLIIKLIDVIYGQPTNQSFSCRVVRSTVSVDFSKSKIAFVEFSIQDFRIESHSKKFRI